MISLIWLTHPTALNDAITAAREESPEEIQAAIAEAINEY